METQIESDLDNQNVIKNETNDKEKNSFTTKGKIDMNEIWNNGAKYIIKYSKLLNFLKRRDNPKDFNINEYWCNIILIPPEIDLSNKISILNLLSKYYDKNKENELIYKISKKIDKYSDSFNAIDPIFGINVYIKAINYLNKSNTFLYAYRYMKKIQDLIKNNIVLVKKNYNLNNVNEFYQEVESNYVNHLTSYRIKFMDDNILKKEQIDKLKNLIDTLISDKYNPIIHIEEHKSENSENNISNDYLYAINKEWIFRAKFFIENYIKAKEQNLNTFYDESFEQDYVYNSYFNEKDKKSKNKKNNKNSNNTVSKLFYAFPGPVNNFEITEFKDHWIDYINLDENDFMKKDLKLNENYYLLNNEDWKLIKSFFGATNEIKRKSDNLDLVTLKFILFELRIQKEFNNINLLKQKYIQINKKCTIKEIKDKIINIVNENLKYIEEDKKIASVNKNIIFYILDKNKKKVLIEMCSSFIINSLPYDSIYIKRLDLKDENTLKDLFSKYDKKNHILIIEIFIGNQPKFFVDLNSNNNKYVCSVCHNEIKYLKDKYNCEICNFSLFCSEKCANKSKNHNSLHEHLLQFLDKKFILSDLLCMNLDSLLPESSSRGRVGLINMGNTCYLNSALQCLSNSEDLTKYFLKEYYKTEINNGSLLGSKGFISSQYYNFINKMWNETNTKFCPKEFRINFCRKTQLFMTSEQQDSQEFLLAVLDNLHEDLNRITNKKYMELQEQKVGESDEEASNRWWNYYKSRENSIIVDLFQGQYKSTIKCSTCGNSSISYDTYMNLGLPIPTKGTQIQIKLLTSNMNFIDINFKIDDDIEIKDIIKKAMDFINKNNYIEFFRNKNEGDSINTFDNNNKEKIDNIIYNNIEVLEFRKSFKMINIYKTAFENINNNIKNKSNIKQPLIDNIKINKFLKNINGNEIILFEKIIGDEPKNNTNIYVYPMIEKEISGIFSNSTKKVILSYPIILTLKSEDSLEKLESLVYQKLEKIIKKKEEKNSLEICFPHFTKGWGNFKNSSELCPICKIRYDKSKKKFCHLFEHIQKKTKIIELMNNYNKGRNLIIYAKLIGPYYMNKEIYSGMPIFNENTKNKEKINLNIYDALDLFNKEEVLEGDNMWFCNKCKQHRNAEKKIEIYRTPIYLIIQLKRFRQRNSIMRAIMGNKNETNIEYKEILNIKDFVVGPDKNNSLYSLYGVIIHKKMFNGGHYYAYCKNKGLWITFNDEKLSKCDNPINKDAYLLFYKRKTLD